MQKGRARRIVSRIYNYSLFAIVAQLLKNIISLSLKLFVKPKICVSDLKRSEFRIFENNYNVNVSLKKVGLLAD